MTNPAAGLALSLIAWVAIGFALVHRAEWRATASVPPLPWRAAAMALTLAALAIFLRPPPEAMLCGVTCIALVAAAGADARTGFLFDAITLPTALLVGTLAIVNGAAGSAAWGVALCVGSFGGLVLISRGRLMGLGDVKALYAVGAAFGPLESLVAIFAACVSGIVTAALAGRLRRGSEVAFGPHLAAGAAFALVLGDPILHGWMGLSS